MSKQKNVGRANDRRIKLTEEQREEIIKKYIPNKYSYNKLALEYNVSKRLIIFIINPKALKKCKEQYKIRRVDGRYYDKEKHRVSMAEHRAYVKKLEKEHKI